MAGNTHMRYHPIEPPWSGYTNFSNSIMIVTSYRKTNNRQLSWGDMGGICQPCNVLIFPLLCGPEQSTM